MLLGLQITTKLNEKVTIKSVFIRELIGKLLILLIVLACLNIKLTGSDGITYVLIVVVLLLSVILITPISIIFTKRTWWEWISFTKTIRHISQKSVQLKAFFCLTLITTFTIIITIYPFIGNSRNFKSKYYPQYPANKELKKYSDFIQSHTQNPVDYVFDLFEKYDLVVLSERIHPEYTQYELISDIISDSRFIERIGNLYTECGSISFQDTVNTYLKTVYANEDSLNKATAFLQRNSNAIWPLWSNTNLFDLLKHVNKLNNSLPDSLKVNWYFTDIPVDWETMTVEKHSNNIHLRKRDSIMADHIIQQYKNKLHHNEKRKKGLVIMNTRHGYATTLDVENTTAVLVDSLPDKVCNVMINTISMIFIPIQHGKWDKAFAMAGNPNVGFDFNNSPFGTDDFDAFIKIKTPSTLKYQDVFTGFIFYKPLEDHISKQDFPYMLYHFEDTIIRRAECVSDDNAGYWKEKINSPDRDKIISNTTNYATVYNLITKAVFSIFIIVIWIICGLIYMIANKRRANLGLPPTEEKKR